MSESKTPKPEMFDEINALFGTIAGAFKLEGDAMVKALEDGSMTLEMGQRDDGDRFVAATFTQNGESRTCRIFKDGIHDEGEDGSSRPKE
ncbi:MAG: hypothetical protein K9H25_05595 [Rhodospirillum sp.]|nr:hypothetical protein [Rhodospirillum sp.]MCF8488963.1 hypothetical protein [Rhodospirillum sp.]MCF8500004.1 hypothetical protein [Rhodospirillum sp.]